MNKILFSLLICLSAMKGGTGGYKQDYAQCYSPYQ